MATNQKQIRDSNQNRMSPFNKHQVIGWNKLKIKMQHQIVDVATGGHWDYGFTDHSNIGNEHKICKSTNQSLGTTQRVSVPPPSKKRKLVNVQRGNMRKRTIPRFKRPRTIQEKLKEKEEGDVDSEHEEVEPKRNGNLNRNQRVILREKKVSRTDQEHTEHQIDDDSSDSMHSKESKISESDKGSNSGNVSGTEDESEDESSESDEEQGVQCQTGILPKQNRNPISRSIQCCIGYMISRGTQTEEHWNRKQILENVEEQDKNQKPEKSFIESAWAIIGNEK